jgi:hypothetical protein
VFHAAVEDIDKRYPRDKHSSAVQEPPAAAAARDPFSIDNSPPGTLGSTKPSVAKPPVAKAAAARLFSATTPPPSPPPTNSIINWSNFPAGQDKSPDTLERENRNEEPMDREEGDATQYDTSNMSAVHAAGQQEQAKDDCDRIELGTADGCTMSRWWDTFLTGSLGGGFLARSLFSFAAKDSVLGAHKWSGPTSVTQNKLALIEMRIRFLEWTENASTNEWVRSKLFNIIVTNPKTYPTLKV